MTDNYFKYAIELYASGFFKKNSINIFDMKTDVDYLDKLVEGLKEVSSNDAAFHNWLYEQDGKTVNFKNINLLLHGLLLAADVLDEN